MNDVDSATIVAAVTLGGAVLGAAIGIAVTVRRMNLTLFLAGLYFLNNWLTRVLWRTEVRGRVQLPPGCGAILIGNHRSSIDPLFVQALIPRPVHWMIAREYVESPWLHWMFRRVGAIPVNRRGVDIAATKLAIRCAAQGDLVGLFPEGRINTTEDLLLPGRPGATMIAIRARVPVIPCYLSGVPYGGQILRPFFTPAKVRLKIGDPIDLSAYYERDRDAGVQAAVTKELLKQIARLAGREDFEPQIAGRRWKTDEGDAQGAPEPAEAAG